MKRSNKTIANHVMCVNCTNDKKSVTECKQEQCKVPERVKKELESPNSNFCLELVQTASPEGRDKVPV